MSDSGYEPPGQRLIYLVSDDFPGHGRKPGSEDAIPCTDFDAETIRIEVDRFEELPSGFRTAQVVLGQFAAPPVGVSARSAGAVRLPPAPGCTRL